MTFANLNWSDTYIDTFVQWTKVKENIYHIIQFWVGVPTSLYLGLSSTMVHQVLK